MPRAKKDGVHVNSYMERTVVEQLDLYCAKTGLERTTAMERIIGSFLDKHAKKSKPTK